VLIIHGGPQASTTTQFSFLRNFMVTHGYVVVLAELPRQRQSWQRLPARHLNDAGDGPGATLSAGIDAVKKLGFIDANKIGVTGWSYGGFMTSWLIGHYQIWKAAMAGAPVTDIYDEYNLSDGNVSGRYGFKGSPYVGDNLKDYRAQSPIAYAAQDENADADHARYRRRPRHHHAGLRATTRTEGQRRARQVHRLPCCGAFSRRPSAGMDVDRRWVEWMDQYLK